MPARASTPRASIARAVPPRAARRSSPAATPSATSSATTKTPVDDRFVVKHILDTGGPIPYGTYFWDTTGAPAGPIVITVDLGAETLSVFRNGYEIGTAAIIFGAKGMDTPLGTFPITQKDADHISNLYDAPMPYMLRLTNDGVSIHGSEIKYENATHGCIGIPLGLARKLFGVVKLGDKVIVTKDKMIGVGQSIVAR
ncbi:hypothetical protein EAH84_09110 [Sphingomonas oligophenolica]|uniref:L,D-TPase catalytic domain-containing protein n=2 Tax=Sphingomonas oligophenolica TaxID=301154 RepID=A0A502CL12_9SPHN|nr:hypothetical protein EAH84_09110 [Sphingomonas oligophenolica]